MRLLNAILVLLFLVLLLGCGTDVTVGKQKPADPIANPAQKLVLSLGGAAGDTAFGVAALSETDFFVAGRTLGAMPGQTAQGQGDIYVARYSGSSQVWLRQFGTPQMEEGGLLALGPDGSLYVSGYTKGNLGGGQNAGGSDVFVANLTSDGETKWVHLFGTTALDSPAGIAVAPSGEVYVVGTSSGPFEGNGAGQDDAFLLSLDRDGQKRWARTLGTVENDRGWAVAIAPDGDVAIAGHTGGALTGTKRGGQDVFVARYAPDGTRRWVQQYGEEDTILWAAGIAVAPDGNLGLASYTYGVLASEGTSFTLGPLDSRLQLLGPGGTVFWTREVKTEASDAAMGIAFDSAGNALLAGFTRGALSGQTSVGSRDLFLASFTSDGSPRWTWQGGSAGSDLPNAICSGPGATFWLAGGSDGQLGDTPNAGVSDAFVLRLGDQ